MTDDPRAGRRPRQRRSEETRRKLIAAGTRLFGEHGYHATSSKRIARAAGVAVGSFYNHFADKKVLLMEIYRQHAHAVHEEITGALTALGPALDGADGRAAVRRVVDQVVRLHDFSPELQREIAALRHTDADFAALGRREDEAALARLRELLEPHRDRLRVDDLDAAAGVVAAAMEAVIHGIKEAGPIAGEADGVPGVDDERLLDALADMVHRYLYRDA